MPSHLSCVLLAEFVGSEIVVPESRECLIDQFAPDIADMADYDVDRSFLWCFLRRGSIDTVID